VHAPAEDKSDGAKHSFYRKLGHVVNTFPAHHEKILFQDFNAKVGKEDIFKPRTGNDSFLKSVMIIQSEWSTIPHKKICQVTVFVNMILKM
jgi:hypothetical protein